MTRYFIINKSKQRKPPFLYVDMIVCPENCEAQTFERLLAYLGSCFTPQKASNISMANTRKQRNIRESQTLEKHGYILPTVRCTKRRTLGRRCIICIQFRAWSKYNVRSQEHEKGINIAVAH